MAAVDVSIILGNFSTRTVGYTCVSQIEALKIVVGLTIFSSPQAIVDVCTRRSKSLFREGVVSQTGLKVVGSVNSLAAQISANNSPCRKDLASLAQRLVPPVLKQAERDLLLFFYHRESRTETCLTLFHHRHPLPRLLLSCWWREKPARIFDRAVCQVSITCLSSAMCDCLLHPRQY